MFEMNIVFTYPVIGIIGGIALIFSSIKKRPDVAPWSKIAVRLAGISVIIWGSLIIIQLNHLVISNTIAGRLLLVFKFMSGGIAIGIFIVLFLSGHLSFKKKVENEESDTDNGHKKKSKNIT